MRKTSSLDKRVRDALAGWEGYLTLIGHYVPWFDAEGIEYAFDDSTAVRLHGGKPWGQNAALMMTPAAWERLRQKKGQTFEARPWGGGGSLSVRGVGYGSRVQFVDTLEGIRVPLYGLWVASLAHLIEGALLRPSESDRSIVTSLIRANSLDETFAKSLSTRTRRAHYLSCLAEARKQPAKK
jgi:hypothetical protein